jgi:hypothetical protein
MLVCIDDKGMVVPTIPFIRLLQCYLHGFQYVIQWAQSAFWGTYAYMHLAIVSYKTNKVHWIMAHISVTSSKWFYNVQMQPHSTMLILMCPRLTSWEYRSDSGGVADLFEYKCEVPLMVPCQCTEFNKTDNSHFAEGLFALTDTILHLSLGDIYVILQTFKRYLMGQLLVVSNVVSQWVHIFSLVMHIISTSSEKYWLHTFKWWCFNYGDLDRSRPLQSGGYQGFLYGNTTAVTVSESDINLLTNSVKVMHIQWYLYLLLYCCYALFPGYVIHDGESTDDIFHLELPMEQLTALPGDSRMGGSLPRAIVSDGPFSSLQHMAVHTTQSECSRLQVADSLTFMLCNYLERQVPSFLSTHPVVVVEAWW